MYLLLAALLFGPARADPTRADVWLAVLDAFPADLVDAVADKLESEVQVRVSRVARPIPLPAAAWYAPRQRWRADRLLDLLPTLVPQAAGARVLALTTVDISTTKDEHPDWGIFGLGELPGDAAVISSFRLRKGVDAATLRRRVVIIAAHEVGHTLGLPHCTEVGCLMLDAEGGVANTDTGTAHLGPACRARLDRGFPARER
ncbi:MAG: hypothetical protein Q8P18_13025 [Pseudomonadota bacterium]|nr:hypothetical protein [Pseudomonadota bacterium]